MTTCERQSIAPTLNKLKLLLWRLDLIKRTFTNLNDCPTVVLSSENYRFFKDRDYRKQMLHTDDQASMEQAINCFKERKPVQIVFRAQWDETVHWYKLAGWPTEDFRYYDGAVEEISEQIPSLKNIFEQQNQHRLEHAGVPYPVALFGWPNCTLQKANRGFVDLLNLSPTEKQEKQLSDLLIGDINLPSLLESLIFDRQITTELMLATDNQGPIKADCQLEYFCHGGKSYLRLAVLKQNDKTGPSAGQLIPKTTHIDLPQICRDLTECWSIDAMLERIYQAKELFPGMDVIMFSDIYARKDKVFVYALGEMNEPLEPGSQFAYSGTIAENIEKEHLEYLIVEDTQSSIKAIDWMLFVPKGIYSYIAKALYVRGAMRTVLIFCSRQKNSFSEHQVAAVTTIATAFHKQLKKIRRQNRPT